ncbi:MAG: zinc metalloprotease HtpX [Candidatus Harrisonbacteria bacterium CG10_big_fil_rev_8_21_14_0_10_49_15]|uniref:Protease HtpX homolog n=1 Tax=Candidatus Harrisonbacteria bacterium CG10_big_fil_rev_8_21_14_0_10_49_15 TaxID=1974587 RepID=A0A2H0ULY6_9BACT|nr:MAG: zinc metalloprotease HtpX [Candidatus Harrisonbacteria bacterium CG10_big_fil_rev_8_21_14_0_10_49_15]
MASLYTHKDSNIRKTWLIFTLFFGVVIGAGFFFSQYYQDPSIVIIASVFAIVWSFTSYWFSDKIVLAMHKAKEVNRENNRELYNIVENLCITAGLPVPRIYIIPEAQLNAFATGRDPKHAVIAVTEGLLQKLDRSELEGVLAHELSHIGNRDMLVSTMVAVLVGFIAILSDIFLRSLWFGGSRRSRNQGGEIMLIIGIVFAILAPIVATLMHLAISRKREFLADASGALLTRYPEGLASALEKLHDDKTPMRRNNNSTTHLWVDDPFNGLKKTPFLHKLFMTHPPIEERIRALRDQR